MKRILIVGSGVVGLCTAYYAARRGHQITVVERGGPDRDCCSLGNAGFVTPSHFVPLAAPGMIALGLKWMRNPKSPFWIKPRLDWGLLDWGWRFWRAATPGRVAQAAPLLRDLNLASRTCFEEFADRLGNSFGLVKKGALMLCKTHHRFDEEAKLAADAQKLGLEVQVLDPKATAKLEPGIRMDIDGAVYYPQDCHLDPVRFMGDLAAELEKLGVRFEWNTEVTGWRLNASRIEAARTHRGEFDADEFVIAGGAWSPLLARGLGLPLPMQAGKGYSLTLTKPRFLPGVSMICTEARVAVTPMGPNLRFGGTMEIAGLDTEINPLRVQGIIESVPKYFPDFGSEDFAGVKPWCGLRPCSPDGLPYLGRTRRFTNLCIGTGHAMMGLSLGPISGKLLTEMIEGEQPSLDLRLVAPDRYG